MNGKRRAITGRPILQLLSEMFRKKMEQVQLISRRVGRKQDHDHMAAVYLEIYAYSRTASNS